MRAPKPIIASAGTLPENPFDRMKTPYCGRRVRREDASKRLSAANLETLRRKILPAPPEPYGATIDFVKAGRDCAENGAREGAHVPQPTLEPTAHAGAEGNRASD